MSDGTRKSYTDEFKLDAIEQIDKAEVKKVVLKKLGIHDSMVDRWRAQLIDNPKPKKPKSPARLTSDADKQKAVARLRRGDKAKEIATDFGCNVSTLYAWAAALKESAPKPKGRGPQKELKIGGGNSKSMEAIVYLRNAKKAMTKQIAAGKATLDDPVYSWCLLALNTLEGTM